MPVVHCKKSKHDVYIGRPSAFGNPFMIGKHGSRDEVIAQYRVWLWDRLQRDEVFARSVRALHGKTLGCWCSPAPCHGDVLLAAAKWLAEQE